MSHANNFTSDLNAWVGLFGQFAAAIGTPVDAGTCMARCSAPPSRTMLTPTAADSSTTRSAPANSSQDCPKAPAVRARSGSPHELGNFMRAQLFSAFSPVKIGMDVMTKDEGVAVDSLVGHGGIFTTRRLPRRFSQPHSIRRSR